MPSLIEDKQIRELVEALKSVTQELKGFASVTGYANKVGYVGDEGTTPMFSEDIRKSREELAKIKEDFSNLSIDFSMAKAIDKFSEVRKEFERLDDLVSNGATLSDKEEKRWMQLATLHENLIKQMDEYTESTGKSVMELESCADLESKLNALMIEGLIKRNEENKLVSKVNKELAYQNKLQEDGVTLQERINHGLEKRGVNVARLTNGFNEVKGSFNGMISSLKNILEPWGKLNQAAANYARNIGMSQRQFRDLQKTINETAYKREFYRKYNVSSLEALEVQRGFTSNIGRQIGFNKDQSEDAVALQSIVGKDSATNFMTQFEKFGLSQTESAERVGKMFKDSEKSGIAFDKYSKIMLDNIKMAQTYTFSKGINGLSEMAKRSAEINMNLGEVAKYADKISTVEGATKAAAGLSVLGGNFALGANPLAMLYNGLNSMEGVQGQMENMLKGLVTYNEEKQQLEMNAYDRMRLRQASQIMGVDYNNMVESAFSLGRESFVSNAARNLGISKDSREYQALLNRSYIENGEAKVNINGESLNVKDLSEEQIKTVVKSDFKDSDGIRKIAETLLGYEDRVEGIKKGIEESKTYFIEKTHIGDTATNILKTVGENTHILAGIGMGVATIASLMAVGGMVNGVRNIATSYRGGGGGIPPLSPTPGAYNMTSKATRSALAQSTYQQAIANGATARQAQMMTAATLANNGATVQQAKSAARGARMSALGGKVVGGLGRGLMWGALGYGVGSMAGGWANEQISADANEKLYDENKDVRNEAVGKKAWGGAVEGALKYGLTGAGIGSMFGPWGALIGGGLGLAYGAITGYANSEDEARKEMLSALFTKHNDGMRLRGNYTVEELRALLSGNPDRINASQALLDKLDKYEGIKDVKPGTFAYVKEYKNGGVIRGRGSGVSDSNLAWVSNNEYIMPADKTLKPNNRVILDSMRSGDNLIPKFKDGGSVKITPTGNRLDIMKVNDNHSNFGLQSPSIGTTKVELSPLTINGSIEFKMNGQTKNIDPNDILNNPVLMRQITDIIAKNLNRQHNYGFEKNEFYKKF